MWSYMGVTEGDILVSDVISWGTYISSGNTYTDNHRDLFVSDLGKSEAGKYLFRAANVWCRCVQYFVLASCG